MKNNRVIQLTSDLWYLSGGGLQSTKLMIEDVQKGIDEEAAAKMAKKLQKGKGFDLNDFKEQIQQMRNMGGLENLNVKNAWRTGSNIEKNPRRNG